MSNERTQETVKHLERRLPANGIRCPVTNYRALLSHHAEIISLRRPGNAQHVGVVFIFLSTKVGIVWEVGVGELTFASSALQ